MWELILSLHHMGTRDQTQGGSLGGEQLYSLSRFTSPRPELVPELTLINIRVVPVVE